MRISLRMFAKVSCSLLVALIFLFARPLGAQHTSPAADAQKPPLLSAAEVGALDQELSGETAKAKFGRDCDDSIACADRGDFMMRRSWWRNALGLMD